MPLQVNVGASTTGLQPTISPSSQGTLPVLRVPKQPARPSDTRFESSHPSGYDTVVKEAPNLKYEQPPTEEVPQSSMTGWIITGVIIAVVVVLLVIGLVSGRVPASY